ncbi:heparan-alpha-glucosaminide N-acetyltransferase domain-containing protein [Vibrio sp. FNV 38]|nr:heparan-alpha-glucosaminide N-acetyltransferase domain-containing protein [Vibrio sp. FNV 38]
MASTHTPQSSNAKLPIRSKRLASIDIMRGLVILIMLIDHVRERFYYHKPVADPMVIGDTEPELFFTRILAHLCAPLFVFLTGISAWLYGHPANGTKRNTSEFLLKRGLFLIFIEMTLVNFSWFGRYENLYLQVIWAIGLSMISLSLLCRLPNKVTFALGMLIVFCHNLLTPINFSPDEFGFTFWTIFHDANWLITDSVINVKVSYPVLPWIGVILLGYSIAPIFARDFDPKLRSKLLMKLGLGSLALLLVLRGFNIYGETANWVVGDSFIETIMSFLNFTKYPPSLHYILLTLGVGMLLLRWFENHENTLTDKLQVFGSAPMFFYILHLYLLLLAYRAAVNIFGTNAGDLFAIPSVGYIWLITLTLSVLLYFPTKAFSQYKHKSNSKILKYF